MKINIRAIRIFKEHKAFYLGILLLIILSSALYLSFRTSSSSIKQSVADNRVACKLEDADFTYTRELTDEEITTLENDYDLILQKSPYIDIDYNDIAVVKVRPDFKKLNLTTAYKGEVCKEQGEAMVDRFFLEANNLKIGGNIVIKDKTYKITGILAVPDYIAMLKSEAELSLGGSRFGLVIMNDADFTELAGDNAKTYYCVKFNSYNMKDFRNKLSETGMILDWTNADNSNRISAFDGEIDAIITMSSIAPLFIMLSSCFIMAVIMGRMLKKEYNTVGTLSALGYRKSELFRHYLLLPVIISLTGSIIGLVLGYFLAEPMEIVSLMEYNLPVIILDFKLYDIILTLLIPLAMNILASVISIFKALRINTSILLKANAGKQKKGKIMRIIPYKGGSFKLRFRLKEMLSNLPRSVLMTVGICIASLFILSGFIINSSIKYVMDNSFSNVYNFEYEYIFNTIHIENTEGGEPFMSSSFNYENNGKKYSVTINGIKENTSFITLKDLDGNKIESGKIAMSNSVADRFNITKGDTITLINNSNLKSYSVTIDEIADINLGDYIYMDLNDLNTMLGLPENTHIGLFSSEKLNIDEKLLLSERTKAETQSSMVDFIDLYRNLLYILATFAAVIGIIVIYIVTIMLIMENSKNISMLKVVGYYDREISSLLLNSNTIPLIIGLILGIPISKFVMQIFFNELTANIYLAFDAQLTIFNVIITVVFIFAIYFFTLFISRRKVLNINMAESLKGRE